MRIALTVLLIAHGALHLLGFVKWWPLSTISQLHSPTPAALVSSPANSRTFASYWLLACLLLLAAAFLLSQGNRDWYQAAFAGLILSQILIVFAWRDAKFGTMPNLLVLVPVIAAAANARFKHQFEDEAVALLAASTQTPGSEVQAAELDGLPPPVQRWLERAGVVGKARARSLWLRQEGQLRTSPSGPWLAATAEQYFSIDAPGFVWNVDTHLYGFLPVAGRDDDRGGTGRMSIKAASVLSLVDARGPKIDSGAMLRFLGEMVWFPSGALSAHVAWAPVDDRTAIATFNDQGKSVDATFEVDASGRVVAIHALRYRGGGVDAVLTPWIVSCSAWNQLYWRRGAGRRGRRVATAERNLQLLSVARHRAKIRSIQFVYEESRPAAFATEIHERPSAIIARDAREDFQELPCVRTECATRKELSASRFQEHSD